MFNEQNVAFWKPWKEYLKLEVIAQVNLFPAYQSISCLTSSINENVYLVSCQTDIW